MATPDSALAIDSAKDAQGRTVVSLRGDVRAPLRAVWELLADTQRLNHDVFGLPAMTLVDQGDAPAGGATPRDVVTASASVSGFEMVFDEHPWIYEAPERYRSVRTFSKGPVEKLETSCALEAVALASASGEGTRVCYEVALTPKGGPVGWAAAKVFVAQLESGFDKVRASLAALDEGRAPAPFVHPDRAAVRAREAPFAPALVADGHPEVLVEGLLEHVAAAPDDEVARIRPYALAEKWRQPREELLALSLDAVRAGLLQMRWETLCPSCKGPVHEAARLEEVPDAHTCAVCHLEIDASRTSNVAAVFRPVFEVRRAAKAIYCLGSPQRTPHWLAQLVLGPGEARDLVVTLGAGRYLVQSPGIAVRTVIDAGETGDERARITLEGARGARGATLPEATPTVRAGRVTLALKNEDDHARRLQLVHEGFADLSATAAHVVDTAAWKRLAGA